MIGHRHPGGCLCGCQFVVGLPGEPVQDSDTPKLAALGVVYMRFTIPCPAGRPDREQVVCYTLAEAGLQAVAA